MEPVTDSVALPAQKVARMAIGSVEEYAAQLGFAQPPECAPSTVRGRSLYGWGSEVRGS